MLKLIKGGKVYAPQEMGECDILIANDCILAVGKDIDITGPALECETYDARGMYVLPGIIDPHVHTIGGGGAVGLNSRVGDLAVERIVEAGVTTVVGCLGFDRVSKSLRSLLMKTLALNEQGISAYMMSGSYNLPSLTVTGSVEEDLVLLEKVIGVKLSLGESLGNWPGPEQIKNLLAECLRGSKLSGKVGFLQVHLGVAGPGWQYRLIEICKEMSLKPSMVVFTHCNRNTSILSEASEYAKAGGIIDLTASFSNEEKPGSLSVYESLIRLQKESVPLDAITVSSDSNATRELPDGTMKYLPISTIYAVMMHLFREGPLRKEEVVSLFTKNCARVIGVDATKGSLEPKKEADIIMLDENLRLVSVLARGEWAVKDNETLIKTEW